MICPDCGRTNRQTAKFCVDCRAALFELTLGTVLQGRYRVDAPLESTHLGVGYHVWDVVVGCRLLMIETLVTPLDDVARNEALARFHEQAGLLARLRHAGLPRVLDAFERGRQCYLVVEPVEGETLEAILWREGLPGLPETQVRDIARQLLDILEYLHHQEPPLLHGDLRPATVLRRVGEDRLVMIDLGVAPGAEGMAGAMLPVEAFMPPEMKLGPGDARSDLYTLGATLYALLTGAPPGARAESLAMVAPGVSPAMAEFVHRALAADPQDRFASAEDMRDALEQGRGPGPDRSALPAQAPDVQDLDLSGTSLTDFGLEDHLRGVHDLRSLDLTSTWITDAGLELVKDTRSLRRLRAGGTLITDAGLRHLAGLASLEELDLTWCASITGAGLRHLGDLRGLRSLELGFCLEVSDLGFQHIRCLGSLRRLVLTGIGVTDRALRFVGGLSTLEELDLSYTRVTDAGMVHLQGLERLETLKLISARVTDGGMQALRWLPTLSNLELVFTEVSDIGAASLQIALPSLQIWR